MPIREISRRLVDHFIAQVEDLRSLNLSSNGAQAAAHPFRNSADSFLLKTEITRIENLESLSSLTRLNLSRNRIVELSNLGRLPNLTDLDLTNNRM